ncbi:hypothetical protein N8290_03665 [Pseudomonadales bacterium]|nr:hypothetical protein [Pseudomonadales bacterium]MDB9868671.1 hypothetical protein [Pseudomonadales bacterium]MDC1308228.1 hypothetical protein [Pseudomonadales bacterium]MDC1368637.1 hypothetical protein [Pseudomonadales bacterium]
MSGIRYPEEFKIEAVKQVTDRGYKIGQVDLEMNFVKGKQNGLLRGWFENGQSQIEATFVDGKENGLTRRWHENGGLSYEATYVDGERIE